MPVKLHSCVHNEQLKVISFSVDTKNTHKLQYAYFLCI